MDGLLWGGKGVNALPRHFRDSRRRISRCGATPGDWWRQLRAIVDRHHRTEDGLSGLCFAYSYSFYGNGDGGYDRPGSISGFGSVRSRMRRS